MTEGSYWRDYKAVRLQGIYYGAFFDSNQSLIDYVNSQQLVNPLVCLGDGLLGSMEFSQRICVGVGAASRREARRRHR